MNDFKDKNPQERRRIAAEANRARLQRVRALPGADDPAVVARNTERAAIAAARAERQVAKEKAAKEKAEQEAREAAERLVAQEAEAEAERERQLRLEAEQKAARDARYAARKKRKG
jgi:hypothetical protein